jgi:hypothetical protein
MEGRDLDALAAEELSAERLLHQENAVGLGDGSGKLVEELDRHMDRIHEILADFSRRRERSNRRVGSAG